LLNFHGGYTTLDALHEKCLLYWTKRLAKLCKLVC